MIKTKIFINFIVFAFVSTVCRAMEPEITQKAVQRQSEIPKIDSKQMAIKYGEMGVVAYTMRKAFELYNIDVAIADKVIELADVFFKDVPEHLVIEKKLAGLELDCVSRLRRHPFKPEFVFSDDYGNNLSYYDLASNKLILNKEYKADRFAYSPDGTLRADAERRKVHICNARTNEIIFSSDVSQHVLEIIFNHDGTKLIVSLYKSLIHFLDLASQQISTTMIDHPDSLNIIRSPDGKTFASTSDSSPGAFNQSVALWNLQDQKINYLCNPEKLIGYHSLAFNFDGTQLAAGRGDGNVMIWNLLNGTSLLVEYHPKSVIRLVKYHPKSVIRSKIALAYGPESRLSSVSDEVFKKQDSSKIDMLNLQTGKITLIPKKPGKVLKSAFSDDGSKLAQVVKDEHNNVYFRYTNFLSKWSYSIEALRFYSQQLRLQNNEG